MVVLPAQKRKQQLLLAALIIVLALILIAWFIAFRTLNPGQTPSSGGEAPPSQEWGEPAPPIVIPRLDWDFISLFGTFHVFESFSGEFTTTGRKNPFLPY